LKILTIDNYDSFTFNLVQYLGELKARVVVFRNDQVTLDEIQHLRPDRILISPGPGRPKDAGISRDVIRRYAGKIPILGVCLGHQCIGEVYGGRVVKARRLMHGKTSEIYHRGKGIFRRIPSPFTATRYHSLIVERKTLPACLEITAWTKDREIMALQHKRYAVFGVQFHPESILTREGKRILRNFIEIERKRK
jgi:anthranilate synthase/aminodeoxychorismate synthase-like glutamine amidotransferase